MNLDQFTDEQLKAELERREKLANKPPGMIENPDFREVILAVKDQTTQIYEGQYDERGKQYIWQTVMEACYGKGYWAWYNKMV